MANYELVDDNDVPEDVIIPEKNWALKFDNDVIVVINYIQFSPEENPDGTKTISIDYDVISGDSSSIPEFDTLIGDSVVDILEDINYLENKREQHKKVLKKISN